MTTRSFEFADGLRTRSFGDSSRFPNKRPRSVYSPDRQLIELQLQTTPDNGCAEPPDDEIVFGSFRLLPARRLLLEGDKAVRIGTRALDLLIALVQSFGRPVSKAELIAIVWPHAFVEEGNLKVNIAALRRSLRDGQAGSRFISTVAGRGYCFVGPLSRSAAARAATRQQLSLSPLTNIPKPLTQPVGAQDVVARVSAQLKQRRFTTLVGPGGIGKTKVAVATAADLANSYEHGVWFVDLTAIGDPSLLPDTIRSITAPVVSIEDQSATGFHFLKEKRMLFVLDNCEHIIEGAAEFVSQIMQAAPQVQILATSREPLGVEGEYLYRLKPLESPPLFSTISATEALEFPAIRLFVEQAQTIQPEFCLRDIDVPVAVNICRKLDGIPLAIELAASTVDTLGLLGIASRLNDPLQLPAICRRTAPPRHRTLGAVVDWSYHLLTDGEQKTLRRLSIFDGSFTVDEAGVPDGTLITAKNELVHQIAGLVAKSLVISEGNGTETRLRLLAMTRAYAFDKLVESGEPITISSSQ